MMNRCRIKSTNQTSSNLFCRNQSMPNIHFKLQPPSTLCYLTSCYA